MYVPELGGAGVSRLRGLRLLNGAKADVVIADGRIDKVSPATLDEPRLGNVDCAGLLAMPAFVDIHAHLDKAYVRDDIPPHGGTLEEAIVAMRSVKASFSVENVVARAIRLIRSSVASGTTRIRSHVDLDPSIELRALEGVQEAARATSELCEVQTVAFPQEGVADPYCRRLMEHAVEAGVDLVGGMPHWEQDVTEQRKHVDFCFALARAANLDIDMHVDETDDARVRTLEMVADAALANGWEGRVTVGHVCALAGSDDFYSRRVISKCRDAGISVVANPATNLVIQGRGDRGLIRRGLTRVLEFREAGVNVCFGQDNVCDGFYPFGRGDMLEIALLGAHALHLTSSTDLVFVAESVTNAPARTWGVRGPEDAQLAPGQPADLVLFHADSWPEVLRLQQPPVVTLRCGKTVGRSSVTMEVGGEPFDA